VDISSTCPPSLIHFQPAAAPRAPVPPFLAHRNCRHALCACARGGCRGFYGGRGFRPDFRGRGIDRRVGDDRYSPGRYSPRSNSRSPSRSPSRQATSVTSTCIPPCLLRNAHPAPPPRSPACPTALPCPPLSSIVRLVIEQEARAGRAAVRG
jgi:hypothetical protein